MTKTNIVFSQPTPDQEAYLRSCEDKGYDPSAVVGGPKVDWQAEAQKHLYYLSKCLDYAEKVEYLTAALRVIESGGAMRGGQELGRALGVGETGKGETK